MHVTPTRFSAPQIPLQGGARPFPNPTLHSTSSASGQARCCLGSTASSSCLLNVALPLKLRRLWGPFRCRLFQTFALFFPLGSRLKIIPTPPSQPSLGAYSTYIYLSTCCSPWHLSHSLSLFSVPAFRRPPPLASSRAVLPPRLQIPVTELDLDLDLGAWLELPFKPKGA